MFHGISNRLDGEAFAYSQHWQRLPRDIQGEICKLVDPDTKRTLRLMSKGTRDAVDNGVRRLLIYDARVIETINAIGRFTSLREIRFLQKELLILSDLPAQLTHVDARICEKISVDALRTLIKQPWASLSVNRATVSVKAFLDFCRASLNDQAPSGHFLSSGGAELSNGEVERLMMFIALLTLSSRDCQIKAADALLFARIPGLKELNISGEDPVFLDTCNELNYEGLAALWANASLTSLDISRANLLKKDDASSFFNTLIANKSLTCLKMDDVGQDADDGLDDEIASRLSRSTTLSSLSIERNHFSNAGMKLIASMTALTELNVSTNDLDEDVLLALVDNTSIKRLCLNWNAVSSDIVKAFVERATVTSLSLRGCYLNEEALQHLWRSQSLLELDIGANFSREQFMNMSVHPSLRRLCISHSPRLRGIDVLALKNNGLISARTTLDFNYEQVNAVLNSEELKAISGARNFSRIDSLKIGGEGFAGGNLSLLPPGLKTLHLVLLGRLVENDLRPLIKQSRLEGITVVGTEIDDAGLALLASLTSLQHLKFSGVQIGASGRQAIEAYRGQASVEFAYDGLWQHLWAQMNDFLGR